MENKFFEDYYYITNSRDELEIFEKCLNSYQDESRLKFLKFLRNEFSHSELNVFFNFLVDGADELDKKKMDELQMKYDRICKLKIVIDDYIKRDNIEAKKDSSVKNRRAIQNSFNEDKRDFILLELYKKLNNKYVITSFENFKNLFNSVEFDQIKWLGTDAELKALIELLIRKLGFHFGRNVNVEIVARFFKDEGVLYNLNSLRKVTGSASYKQIISNDPANEIYLIIEEIKSLAYKI
jgi:hypothetical protein